MVFSLQPIARSQSLYQQAYRALYTAILSGEMAPGERLIETQLAARFAVSRTPIREAIRQLQLKGLVMQDENNGLCVAKISVADALHLYDCRIALEQLAVEQACQNATTEDLQSIEANLEAMQQLVASGAGWPEPVAASTADAATESAPPSPKQNATSDYPPDSGSKLLELNSQFHRLIATSSGNPWLGPLLDQVSDKITLLHVRTLRSRADLANIHVEHRQIFEAIAQQNTALATTAIVQHLATSKERIARHCECVHP